MAAKRAKAAPPALAGDSEAPARSRRANARAQQIMDVAEKLFHEQGYAATSMDDIARETGLLKGSLYYYISSKEDLLYWIVQDVHEVSHAQLEEVRQRRDLSAFERILYFVEQQVIYNAHNVTRVAVYHHEWHRLEGDRLEEVRKRRAEYNASLRALIDEAKRAGELPSDLDSRLAVSSVLAVICWPYTWYRGGTLAPARLAKFCANFVRGGLLSSGSA